MEKPGEQVDAAHEELAAASDRKLQAVIAHGGDDASKPSYSVEFKEMKLVVTGAVPGLGMRENFEMDADVVVAALFAKVKTTSLFGKLVAGSQGIIIAALKAVQ